MAAIRVAIGVDVGGSGIKAAAVNVATGALVGNLLGARDGESVLPDAWLDHLVEREIVATVADDLVAHVQRGTRDVDRYPPW